MTIKKDKIKLSRHIIMEHFIKREQKIKSAHIAEAFACSLGYLSNASFIASDLEIRDYNRTNFYKKLIQLGYSVSEPYVFAILFNSILYQIIFYSLRAGQKFTTFSDHQAVG